MTDYSVSGSPPENPFLRSWPLWVLAVLAAIASLAGGPASPELRYERGMILNGEWWRLLTGHLVHLGMSHLLLNLAGLALIGWIFSPGLRPVHWLVMFVFSWLTLSVGFLALEPELAWYVGLSGLLHGLLLGALVLDRGLDARTRLVLVAAVVLKLAWEQWAGSLPLTATAAGGPVVVDAHLYGGIGGLLAAASWRVHARRRSPV